MRYLLSNITTKIALLAWSLAIPVISHAQSPKPACRLDFSSVRAILLLPTCIINRYIIPGLIFVAVLAFMWGIVNYMQKLDQPAERAKMAKFMGWSIVAIFVITSMWAILYLVGNTLQLGQ